MAYKPKDLEPPANEWGQFRSRLAQRGYSQAWIDKYLGTQRERMRETHDGNMRNGYAVGQMPDTPQARATSNSLIDDLTVKGWNCSFDGMVLEVIIPGPDNDVTISYRELADCNYTDFDWPDQLKIDICNWMTLNGHCASC